MRSKIWRTSLCDHKFKEYEAEGCTTYFNKKDHLWTLYEYETGAFRIPASAEEGVIYGGCNCGNCHITILPTGDVYACRRVAESKVGNVLQDRLADVWVCQMEAYRDYTKFEKCAKCELLAYCRGCPAVAKGTNGDFYSPDPQCWKEIELWNPFPPFLCIRKPAIEKKKGMNKMDILELMKHRRSIRKYQEKQIARETLEAILEAGLYAPNAGGGQRSKIVGIRNAELAETIGKLNIARFDRSRLSGNYVSKDQPSIIDDPSMKSGFYGAPTVCVVFGPRNFLYSIPDAFCCAENMVLAATALGVSSCIVARGEDTFDNELGAAFLKEWEIPENYVARCFVLLGYCKGEYPMAKPRKPDRIRIVE